LQRKVLQANLLEAKKLGSYHFRFNDADQMDVDRATQHYAKQGLDLEWVEISLGAKRDPECWLRLAPDIHEYAARRLAEHSGKLIHPLDPSRSAQEEG
jgi:hypothetical protein